MRKARELSPVADRTASLPREAVVLAATFRNEALRLPWFLSHYRRLGVGHFLMIDNGSDDGSVDLLRDQPDVSLWRTDASYAGARYGMDWIAALLDRHAHGRWALVVDADEFLVYPHWDTRPLPGLTEWLDGQGLRSMGALVLDMYPEGPLDAVPYRAGEDPFTLCRWFDGANLTLRRNPEYGNLWIRGGPRARVFFADRPRLAPALNKVPLVRWQRGFAWASSTHMLLPRGLNQVYDRQGGETLTGVLLHAKFLHGFSARAAEEAARGEHFDSAREYRQYLSEAERGLTLHHPWSERLAGWPQLVALGLMSQGDWL